MTRTAHRPLTTIPYGLLVAVAVLVPDKAQGGEVGHLFANSVNGPVAVIDDDELGRLVGLGGVAGDSGEATPWDRIAVILWDEAKPRRTQPQAGFPGGRPAADASASITVAGGVSR